MPSDSRTFVVFAAGWRTVLALAVLLPVLTACGGDEAEPPQSETARQQPVAPEPVKPGKTASDPELPDPTGVLSARMDGMETRWQVGGLSRAAGRNMWEPLNPGVMRVILYGKAGSDSGAGPLQVEFQLHGLTAKSRVTHAVLTHWPEGPNGAAVGSQPGRITLELESVVKKGAALELAGQFSGRVPATADGASSSDSQVRIEEGRFRVLVPRKPYR